MEKTEHRVLFLKFKNCRKNKKMGFFVTAIEANLEKVSGLEKEFKDAYGLIIKTT